MSTSRCGNICIMPPKCSCKERRRGFSNRSSVDAGRHCVFLGESKITLFGLPKVDALRLLATGQHNPDVITTHCVCHATLFPFRPWTDAKTKDIINCLYFYFESWRSRLWKGALHFQHVLVVFGQSQCTGSVGQSEQTAFVGRRDFVENEVFERGGA